MSVMSQDVVEHYYKAHRLTETVEDWANQVSTATEEMELLEPTNPGVRMPRIGDPSKEIQIHILLERHREARAIMDLIEEQLLKLNYELPQKEVTQPPSSQHCGSKHQGGSHHENLAEDSAAQGLPSEEIWPYIPLGSDSGDSFKRKKKQNRSKRPKTELEKNRHIHKVFIRENGILPLLNPSAQL
ncbi:uncharacterized protein FMAN_14651 [Fusarium mangiferae]|uniref:Uncharacterized protein n=1 Tax=Fusarium mangiferae TaxID=192010 RepID=A0A1L7ULW1_FUSMA|nr:uncharacterized protein FMAN_14651 [Fusarium mangiferae]CVL08777.1 uncharacterized protein FMAN_14651 [Fusarium mangiferae]